MSMNKSNFPVVAAGAALALLMGMYGYRKMKNERVEQHFKDKTSMPTT
jgi:hypothetical protein